MHPQSLTVGYLPQEPDARPDELLLDYLAPPDRRAGGVARARPAHRGASPATPTRLDEYTEALERFLALGGDDLEVRAAVVCADLGLPADRLAVPVGALSGGQAARAALAVILLARFDVLLLDEPTNDLDFAGLERLERFVRETPSAVVVVSHDRAFLDGAVERILEIEEHTHRAVEYAGGWSDYVDARELARGQQTEAYEKYQAERRTLATRAQTQRSWSEQGVRAVKRSGETDKFIRHKNKQSSEKQAAKAKQTDRARERLEARAVEKPWEGWRLDLVFETGERSGAVVARLDDAVVRRGSFTLGPLDLEIEWQDRLAIVGPNGSGKTTLLRAILGEQPLDAGSRWVGPGGALRDARSGPRRARDRGPATRRVLRPDRSSRHRGPFTAREARPRRGRGRRARRRRCHPASGVERSSPRSQRRNRTASCSTSRRTTSTSPRSSSSRPPSTATPGTLLLVTHDRRLLERVDLTRTLEL